MTWRVEGHDLTWPSPVLPSVRFTCQEPGLLCEPLEASVQTLSMATHSCFHVYFLFSFLTSQKSLKTHFKSTTFPFYSFLIWEATKRGQESSYFLPQDCSAWNKRLPTRVAGHSGAHKLIPTAAWAGLLPGVPCSNPRHMEHLSPEPAS